MKQIFILSIVSFFVSCGPDKKQESATATEKAKVEKELTTVQDENVEIEQLDGELDSLITQIESL